MTPRPVGLVTCRDFAGLSADDRPLLPLLQERGVAAEAVCWDDPSTTRGAFRALVLRSTWDYFQRVEEFRAWLGALKLGGTVLLNPVELVQANLDKVYLLEFQRRGIRIAPTLLLDRNGDDRLPDLLEAQGWERAVVKPRISGAAYQTWRVRRDEAEVKADRFAEARRTRDLMIQEYLPEIESDGELSFVFIDGTFSHAVRKRPRPGDFRVQSRHGGTNEPFEASRELLRQAEEVLALAPGAPVYARVDGILRGDRLNVMELELIEPNLFFSLGDGSAVRFADAVVSRLPGCDGSPTAPGR